MGDILVVGIHPDEDDTSRAKGPPVMPGGKVHYTVLYSIYTANRYLVSCSISGGKAKRANQKKKKKNPPPKQLTMLAWQACGGEGVQVGR